MAESHESAALHRIETHEKVCAERYGNIWEALKGIRNDMSADRATRAAADQVVHTRLNTMSNRMWGAVAAVGAAAVGGLGVTVFYLLTKGHA